MTDRVEKRLVISLSIKVYGMDSEGMTFNQPAHTLDITHDGARIEGLPSVVLDSIVGVQYGGEKSRFRVVWIAEMGGRKEGQIGLQLISGSKGLWSNILDATPEQLRFIESQSARAKTTGF